MKKALLCTALLVVPLFHISAQDYRVRRIGPDNGKTTFAYGLNSSGAVAGAFPLGTDVVHAYQWSRRGGLQDLGTLGGSSSVAFAINDAGDVAGYSLLAGNMTSHAFRYTSSGGMEDLGALSGDPNVGTVAFAINASGQVLGIGQLVGNGPQHPVLWTSGKGLQDLGTLGGDLVVPLGPDNLGLALNDLGQATGSSFLSDHVTQHAFLWDPNTGLQDLGTLPGGTGSRALGINNNGEVVGESFTNSSLTTGHAFRWTQAGGMQDLGTLGGVWSQAFLINSSGTIVGNSNLGGIGSPTHAFVWTPELGMQDLSLPGKHDCLAAGLSRMGEVLGACKTRFLWNSETGIRAVRLLLVPLVGGFNDAGQAISRTPAAVASPTMHVALVSSQNPSNSGESVTFSATITSVQGPPPDGEIVQLRDGGKVLGTVALMNGVASLTTSALKTGTHQLRAFYSGDSNYDSGMSPILTQTVLP